DVCSSDLPRFPPLDARVSSGRTCPGRSPAFLLTHGDKYVGQRYAVLPRRQWLDIADVARVLRRNDLAALDHLGERALGWRDRDKPGYHPPAAGDLRRLLGLGQLADHPCRVLLQFPDGDFAHWTGRRF